MKRKSSGTLGSWNCEFVGLTQLWRRQVGQCVARRARLVSLDDRKKRETRCLTKFSTGIKITLVGVLQEMSL